MSCHIKVIGTEGRPILVHRDEIREVIPAVPAWPVYDTGTRAIMRLANGCDLHTRTTFEEIEPQLLEGR